mmetsp:Transcript_16002/g.17766  ORF Transcript_16002/g.17766 Transcript_16002/m.17766 type:complete len:147 (+) Transcript_16002:94-534(+)
MTSEHPREAANRHLKLFIENAPGPLPKACNLWEMISADNTVIIELDNAPSLIITASNSTFLIRCKLGDYHGYVSCTKQGILTLDVHHQGLAYFEMMVAPDSPACIAQKNIDIALNKLKDGFRVSRLSNGSIKPTPVEQPSSLCNVL